MLPLIKGIVIAVVTAALVIPTGYYIYSDFNNASPPLVSFVPADSAIVLRGDYNNTSFYAYSYNNTTGIIANLNFQQLTGNITINKLSNGTSGINVTAHPSLYGEYEGYQIFEFSNVSVSIPAIVNLPKIPVSLNIIDNFSEILHNNTFYASPVSGNLVALGTNLSVRDAIDAHLTGNNFQGLAVKYFNGTSDYSVYVGLSNRYFMHLSANVFANETQFSVEFRNGYYAAGFYLTASLMFGNGLFTGIISGNYVNGTIGVGTSNYYEHSHIISGLMNNKTSYQ
ncbi:MAG: hypothetical protein M1393_01075 [Candidatus Thermoplasmatota archaeon]|nr:hypothetical protein [Candidatus Thermoplasmatota archaeon]MDA8144257.1 hypothetical protein [Thermoplasmatales archaeon]